MALEITPWPKKGNKAFATGVGGKLIRIQKLPWNYPQHAEAFKIAAEMVIDAYQATPHQLHRDELFFPVAYLYRHSLELKLKDLIGVGVDLLFFRQDKVKGVLEGHSLAKLWTQVKSLLEDRWPTADKTPLKATEAVINEFHQADPDGQTFRYEADKEGRRHRHEKLPSAVSLSRLRSTMDATYYFLDCCESDFHQSLECLLDAQRSS